MKNIVYMFAWMFLSGSIFAQETIEISGKIKGLGNESMQLRYSFGGTTYADSVIAENDVISFKKEIKLPGLTWIHLIYNGKDKEPLMNFTGFFVENGTPIVLDGDLFDLYDLKASNSPLFDEVAKLRKETKQIRLEVASLQRTPKDIISEDSAQSRVNKTAALLKEEREIQQKFIETNGNMVYAAYLYSSNLLGKSADEVEKVYTGFTEEVKNSSFGKQINTYLESAKKLAPGATAPGFTQKDINNETVTLEQYRGNYVLLVFWGSWCGPCRRTHPHLMELVNVTYKDSPLQLIGFASDREKDKWKEAIELDKLDFVHCNLFDKYEGQDVAALYNVRAFPTKVLIDPQGKIVETVIGASPTQVQMLDDLLEKSLKNN